MKNLLIAAVFLVLFSCNTGNKEADQNYPNDHSGESTENMTADTSEGNELLSDQDVEQFKAVSAGVADQLIDSYLEIKDALVKTNGAEAKKAAEAIHKNLESAEGEGLAMIREDIEQIANTDAVEQQREHFDALSKNIYSLVKAQENVDMTLYRQYCPMAFKNTGAFWLSASEEIRNPYFGDKMLKCGKVEETITAN